MEYVPRHALEIQAEICKALSDPKRLAILHALREGELSVGELAGVLSCHMPNVSQHLSVLRSAGLVSSKREGNVAHYCLSEPRILDACDIIFEVLASTHRARAVSMDVGSE